VEEWLNIGRAILQNPDLPDEWLKEGRIAPDTRDTMQAVARMPEDDLRQELLKVFAPQPHEQPYY
jgi:hypothetical protein